MADRQRRVLLGLAGMLPLAAAGGATAATEATAASLIVLVRHAEKAADDPRDPSLSAAGQARAAALADLLGSLPVRRILHTPLKRTALTVAPLAAAHGLEAESIDFADTLAAHARAMAAALQATPAGVAVAAGHSNTLPLVIEALGGPADIRIEESQYDDLFLLLPQGQRAPWLLRAGYGLGA